MTALALEALAAANAAGVTVSLDGDGLILEPTPPAALIERIKAVKPDLLRVLAGREAARAIIDTAEAAAGMLAASLGGRQTRTPALRSRWMGRFRGAVRMDAGRALPRAACLGSRRSLRRRAPDRRPPGGRGDRGLDRDRDALRVASEISADRT